MSVYLIEKITLRRHQCCWKWIPNAAAALFMYLSTCTRCVQNKCIFCITWFFFSLHAFFLLIFRHFLSCVGPTVLCTKVFKDYKEYQGVVNFLLILVHHVKLATFQLLARVRCAHYKNTITSLLAIDHGFLTMKTKLPFHLSRYNSSTNLAFRQISEEVLTVSFK